jgi:epsin
MLSTEDDLQRAIRESEQEARENERKKKEALELKNQNNLFGNQK